MREGEEGGEGKGEGKRKLEGVEMRCSLHLTRKILVKIAIMEVNFLRLQRACETNTGLSNDR